MILDRRKVLNCVCTISLLDVSTIYFAIIFQKRSYIELIFFSFLLFQEFSYEKLLYMIFSSNILVCSKMFGNRTSMLLFNAITCTCPWYMTMSGMCINLFHAKCVGQTSHSINSLTFCLKVPFFPQLFLNKCLRWVSVLRLSIISLEAVRYFSCHCFI